MLVSPSGSIQFKMTNALSCTFSAGDAGVFVSDTPGLVKGASFTYNYPAYWHSL